MRRRDREVTDRQEIIDIISRCEVCRLGMAVDHVPYIVPLNFGYEASEGELTLYFHSAKEGRKLEMLAQNPRVCFEMTCNTRLMANEDASKYTMAYESVMGTGDVTFCQDREEKRHGLALLMRTYAPDRTFAFPDAVLDAVCIFQVKVRDMTGKRNQP